MSDLIATGETEVADRPGVRVAQAGVSVVLLLAVIVPGVTLVVASAVAAVLAAAPLVLSGFGSFGG
jgi:hypothetical protein